MAKLKSFGKILGVILVLSAGILWGHSGFFVHLLSDQYHVSEINISTLRIVWTAIFMSILMLIIDRKAFCIKCNQIPPLLISGMLGIVGSSVFYFIAIQKTSMSVAAVLMYTAPILVMLMSLIVFREKLNIRKVICVLLSFIGAILSVGIIGNDHSFSFVGILFGFLAGLSYALYSVASGYSLKKGVGAYTISLYSFIFASVVIIFVCDKAALVSSIKSSPMILLYSSLQAFMTCLAPYVLYTMGIKFTNPSSASVMSTVELIVASIIGFFSFGESIGIIDVIGMVLIVSSIVILNTSKKKG